MNAIVGETIPLSIRIIENTFLVTGLTVTVRVINLLTKTEVLASTPLVEGDPGLYCFNWDSAPGSPSKLLATYSYLDRTTSEEITISKQIVLATGQEVLTGQITDEILQGQINESVEGLSGIITDQETLTGEISEETLAGSLIEKETISGEINEDTITGVLKDC